MTYIDLRRHLDGLAMFTPQELDVIIRTCGLATIGTAVIACELCGIKLDGSDVDRMFNR